MELHAQVASHSRTCSRCFFRGAFLLHRGTVFFPVALSLLHDGAVFSYGVFSFAYITIPAISKQKEKTTPTQSNGAI
jgi:hypothetical protein